MLRILEILCCGGGWVEDYWKCSSTNSSVSIQISKVQLVRIIDVDEQKVKGEGPNANWKPGVRTGSAKKTTLM